MITKRMLGIGFIVLGLLGIAAMFIRDLTGTAEFEGIGPVQQLALLVGGVVILIGLSLLPLGDRPA
jgi:SpoU rRNA methylase family enzyme